ncbi:MAG: oligosaccharide flippase family protein [Gemmatimonadaceae bacterium]
MLRRGIHGARVLLVRGVVLRAISASTNFILIVLVAPAEFGLLAVVRGAFVAIQFVSDLGFELAMIRRAEEPSQREMAAFGGFRILVLLAVFATALGSTYVVTVFGLLPGQWSGWMLAAIASLLMTPLQTVCKIRLERDLQFTKLSFLEVNGILLQNVGLVLFALAGHFVRGIFLVQIGLSVYYTVVLHRMVPGARVSFDLRFLRPHVRDSAGFSLSLLLTAARDSFTPILIAKLFGLDVAGLWAFATRFGQFLLLTFEGYARVGMTVAGRMARDQARLRELATSALRETARTAYPIVGVLYAALPLVAVMLPRWGGAVGLAQLYVLSLGVLGIFSVALSPVVLATRGLRAVLTEQSLSTGTVWLGVAALWFFDVENVAIAFALGNVVSVLCLARLTPRAVRPPMRGTLTQPLLIVSSVVALVLILQHLGARPWFVAAAAAAAPFAWLMVQLTRGLRGKAARPLGPRGAAGEGVL